MHRIIIKPPKEYEIDHADRNGLNNQRSNLRICNKSQNKINHRKYKNNTTGFIGVYKNNGKFFSRVLKNEHLGTFTDKIEAAKARDRRVFEIYGNFATLNFPLEKKDSQLNSKEAAMAWVNALPFLEWPKWGMREDGRKG